MDCQPQIETSWRRPYLLKNRLSDHNISEMNKEDEDDFDLVDVGDETSESQMCLTRTFKAHLDMAFINWKDSSMHVHVAYASRRILYKGIY